MKVGRVYKGLLCLQIGKELNMARGKCALSRVAIVEVEMENVFYPKRVMIESQSTHVSCKVWAICL